jgi:putative hemolysin
MDPFLISLFVVLFFLSAFFSGTELALMSLAKHKIDSLVKQRKYWSKALKKIKENNDRLLITILIWNNLVNVYTAALATTIAISFWEAAWLAQATSIWIATWIVTFLLLLFWEIIPKSLATKNAATISLLVAPIYKFLMLILFPVITFMEVLIRIFSPKAKIEQLTDEEIDSFIDMWREAWTLEKEEHEKIKNILDLEDTYVEEIMTPRVKIEALSINTTVKDALDFFLSHTHSRIPIFTWTIDKIDYFLNWRELLLQVKNGNLSSKLSELDLQEVMKTPLNQTVDTLFTKFQKEHKIMAIVIDEYGWVSWLITLEDIIEEVFGEIRDETDKEVDEIKKLWNDSLLVESDALIEDVLEKLWLELADAWIDEKEFDWETIGYVITHKVEWFPSSWEVISFKCKPHDRSCTKLEFTVIDIKNHRIGKIEVKKS